MPTYSERTRLRHAGRIPQETLDYLAEKKRQDGKPHWWEIPIFLTVAASLVLLVMLLFRSAEPLFSVHTLFICSLILVMSDTLRRRIRSYRTWLKSRGQ